MREHTDEQGNSVAPTFADYVDFRLSWALSGEGQVQWTDADWEAFYYARLAGLQKWLDQGVIFAIPMTGVQVLAAVEACNKSPWLATPESESAQVPTPIPTPTPTPTPTPPTEISRAGVAFVAEQEGVELELYDDPAGNCTIGAGHLVHLGPCDGQDSETEFLDGITEEQAYDLLEQDLADAEQAVHDLVQVPLTQNQFDALVSFVYNVGGGNFEDSDLLTRLNQGEYDAVPDELNRWVYGNDGNIYPGLQRRREAEGEMFSGVEKTQ